MVSKKTFGILIAFLLLAGLATFLLFKGKPKVSNANPLKLITRDEYHKIKLQTPVHTILLVQEKDQWEMQEPFKDQVEDRILNQLLTTLENFTVESIISENKENYSRFDLTDSEARRLTVHKKGNAEPVLDGYFGKQAANYGSTYFRFEGQVPVHLVNDFPSHYFQRIPNEYRKKTVFPPSWDKLIKVEMMTSKGAYVIEKSSHYWLANGQEEPISDAWVKDLWPKLRAIRVQSFENDKEKANQIKFDEPILQVKAHDPDNIYEVIVGPEADWPGEEQVKPRYGKMEGRRATLIMPAQPVNDLIAHIWNASK